MGFAQWLRNAAWSVLAAGALLLWHGQVRAACDADALDAVFLEESGPLPAQSAPPGADPLPAAAAAKLQACGGFPVAAAACHRAAAGTRFAPRPAPVPRDLPWRAYCARSSRLLR